MDKVFKGSLRESKKRRGLPVNGLLGDNAERMICGRWWINPMLEN